MPRSYTRAEVREAVAAALDDFVKSTMQGLKAGLSRELAVNTATIKLNEIDERLPRPLRKEPRTWATCSKGHTTHFIVGARPAACQCGAPLRLGRSA